MRNEMATLKTYMTGAQDRLAAAGVDRPDLDARLLVQHVLGWAQTKLLLNLNHVLTETEVKALDEAVARRVKREPVSRIIGRRAFWKSEFKVSPQTLDPRPDSETLIEAALKYVTPSPERILDLGTGTGCLLLSLLMEWPKASGVGLDISEEAVETARENAQAMQLSDRVEFVATDWNEYPHGIAERHPLPNPLPQGRRGDEASSPSPALRERAGRGCGDAKANAPIFDLLISNPPYIAEAEIAALEPEVAQYDPMRALIAADEGLGCYISIARHLNKWLKPGGWVLFEIGHAQGGAVKSILAEAGMSVIHLLPDLAGSDRVILARRP